MNILILGGAGMMSVGTARDLLSELSPGVTRVVAADASETRLAALKAALPDPRLETAVVDVTDEAAVAALLANCDLCINGVPTFAGLQMAIFEACLKAGRPYADFGGMGVYTVKQKAEHARFVEAGVTAVIGLGADPGLSNLICRAAADRLDTIKSINLYWTATRLGPASPVLMPPYSVSTVLAEFANPSQQFLGGRLVEVPPQSGAETLDLPAPFGRTTFIHTQHSEPLTVPFAKGIAEKGIEEFTWKLALPAADQSAWIGLVQAGFGDFDTPVTVKGPAGPVAVKPLDVLTAVIDRNIAANAGRIPETEGHELHMAVGRGVKDDKPTTVIVTVLGNPDPLYDGYIDAGTSMNMSIAAQQILKNPLKPGVWAAEEYFDVDAYLAEVRKRKFTVEIETTTREV
jgi:saccharopine dehydrogenase-like NADP-dependent oxidoreductase